MKIKVLVFFSILIVSSCISDKETKNFDKINKNKKKIVKKELEIPEVEDLTIPAKKNENNLLDIDNDFDNELVNKQIVTKKNNEEKYNRQIRRKKREISNLDNLYTSNSLDLTNIEDTKIKELNLKTISVEEDNQVYISLIEPGWIIKKVDPPSLKLINRENFRENTLFKFIAEAPSIVKLIFIRYDEMNDTIIRQPYRINIISKGYSELATRKEYSKLQHETKEKKEASEEKIIADGFFKQGRLIEAKNHYLNVIKEGIEDPEVYYKLGIIEKESNNFKKALEYFNLASTDKESLYYLESVFEAIKILKMQEKYKEAIDVFYKHELNNKIENKDFDEIYILLADLYFNLRDYDNAVKIYRRFLQLFPDSKYYDKAFFYLAYSLESLAFNPDFKEAYRIYNSILEKRRESEYYDMSKKRIMYLERHYLNIH